MGEFPIPLDIQNESPSGCKGHNQRKPYNIELLPSGGWIVSVPHTGEEERDYGRVWDTVCVSVRRKPFWLYLQFNLLPYSFH